MGKLMVLNDNLDPFSKKKKKKDNLDQVFFFFFESLD